MTVRFRTREIGSLAKPSWRVKTFAGRELEERDVDEARRWGTRLGIHDHELLVEQLSAWQSSEEALAEVDDWACRYALSLFERTGLDVVYDGEQRRTEMYDHVAAHADGFESRGLVRAFDNKYYEKAAVVGVPEVQRAYDVDEFQFVSANSEHEVKVPLTGAYTMVDWSYDEHYGSMGRLGASVTERKESRRALLQDIANRVVLPNASGLADVGVRWFQIDEPAAATRIDEADLVVEGFNLSCRGLPGLKSLHICFSDYSSLWPSVLGLEDCLELQLEFANRDSRELGTTDEARPGYERTLKLFRQEGSPGVGLGVLDIHSDFIEPAELVRDRILYAVRVLGDPKRIEVNPDCGLRTRTWDVVYEKLSRMVEGTRLAEETLSAS